MNIFQKLFKKEVEKVEKDFKTQIKQLQKTKENLTDLLKNPQIKAATRELKRLKDAIVDEKVRRVYAGRFLYVSIEEYDSNIFTLEQGFDNLLLELEKLVGDLET